MSVTVRLTCSIRPLGMCEAPAVMPCSCGIWRENKACRQCCRLLLFQPQANLRSSKIATGGREMADTFITIGQLAARTGVAVSALRYYEEKGLLTPLRTRGNQRRFLRSDIRRVSFILIAQKLGLALTEIEQQLSRLPQGRAPTL